MFGITVYQLQDGRRVDLAHFTTATTASEMEDTVTRLHKSYPAPGFTVEVDNHPTPTIKEN
jgi:hypothetical protein